MDKGTFDDKRINLWAPVIKTHKDKYLAVLTDDSIDRDDEVVGKEAMIKIMKDDTFLAGLIDHENKILGMVCEWTNKTLEKINGHNTLLAEPKFYKSNPKAMIIKGMLDDGAKMGVSIGAIIKDKEEREVLGKVRTVFTDLELIEASFVAVPSNRHAHALAIAKNYTKNMEVKTMSEETESTVEELNKTIKTLETEQETKVSEIKDLEKELSELKNLNDKTSEAVKADKESVEKEHEELINKVNSELESTKKELEELKSGVVLKGKQEYEEQLTNNSTQEETNKTIVEKLKAGMIPVIRQ